MSRPKDSILRDLYACFLANKVVPKELSDAFVKSIFRGRKARSDRGMRYSASPRVTGLATISNAK